MGLLIDTSILVASARGRSELAALLERRGPEEPVGIAAITASELLHGVYRADAPPRRAARERYVESVLARLPVLPFDLLTARLHARLWAELAGQGVQVAAHDPLIAATAMTIGWDLATLDRRSFPRVPGLSLAKA